MTARHPRGPVETARGAVYPWQSKTIRFLHRMYDAETADEVATMEITAVYMDLDARKSTPIPAELSARFAAAIASE